MDDVAEVNVLVVNNFRSKSEATISVDGSSQEFVKVVGSSSHPLSDVVSERCSCLLCILTTVANERCQNCPEIREDQSQRGSASIDSQVFSQQSQTRSLFNSHNYLQALVLSDLSQATTLSIDDRIYSEILALSPNKSDLRNCYKLADFEIKTIIGEGKFGRVALVKIKKTGEHAALKILAADRIIRRKQVDHVRNERLIMTLLDHPFIIKLRWHYADNQFVYLLTDYEPGGELFYHLQNRGQFSDMDALLYASEVLLVLEYLHDHSIMYRDLKPENILIDTEGHIKLIDYEFTKVMLHSNRSYTICGTPDYLAPEIITNAGHNKAVDWWAFGVLVYELLVGKTPFKGETELELYEMIVGNSAILFPPIIKADAKHLIKQLLVRDKTKRLGNTKMPIVPKIISADETKLSAKFGDLKDWIQLQKSVPSMRALFPDF